MAADGQPMAPRVLVFKLEPSMQQKPLAKINRAVSHNAVSTITPLC